MNDEYQTKVESTIIIGFLKIGDDWYDNVKGCEKDDLVIHYSGLVDSGSQFEFISRARKRLILIMDSKDLEGEDKFCKVMKELRNHSYPCTNITCHKKKWYKKKFREIAIPRVTYFARQHNLMVNQVRIKNQKTMWGSCSSKNNINLNYLLLMAPMKVIDYVIIHELVHTIHRNHSIEFWSSVESIMPDYKEHKLWLKANGYKLRRV